MVSDTILCLPLAADLIPAKMANEQEYDIVILLWLGAPHA